MTTFREIVLVFMQIGEQIVGLFIALVALFFFYNIFNTIRNSDKFISEKSAYKKFESITWSVIALAVLFSVWGIILFIKKAFLNIS